MSSMGERIAKQRKLKKLTQEQLAKLLNVKREIISYYEKDLRCPKINDIIELSKILNVSADYLLCLTKESSPNISDMAINKKLGLSSEAAEKLKWANTHKFGKGLYICETINSLLEDFNFEIAAFNIKRLKILVDSFAKSSDIQRRDFASSEEMNRYDDAFFDLASRVEKITEGTGKIVKGEALYGYYVFEIQNYFMNIINETVNPDKLDLAAMWKEKENEMY